jgi:putative molybdopterin biosynthesis protein
MSIKLNYSFFSETSPVAPYREIQLHNPLFAMLAAVRDEGSIGKAASALNLSYRYLWGFLKKQEAVFGQSLLAGRQGQSARLSDFGERLFWAEKKMRARFLPEAESLAAKLDLELSLAVEPDLTLLLAFASHDLLFPALRDCLKRESRVLLDVSYVGSARALEKLNEGACLLAGIHLPLGDERLCRRGSVIHLGLGPQLRLGDTKLIRFATREQGLIIPSGNPLGLSGLPDVERTGVVFVNRPAGSGTRLLLDELLFLAGISSNRIVGYATEEATHLSVAASIAAGNANCGFGLRAAAECFGLDFLPVTSEQYFLVCCKAALETEAMQAVLKILLSDHFRQLADSIPGYGTQGSGEIVSLRATLPWYK